MSKDKATEAKDQPEVIQADYVMINNGSLGPVTIPVTPHRSKLIKKVKGISIMGKYTLTPGINRIPANVWHVIREDVKRKLVTQGQWNASTDKKGMILEINYKVIETNKSGNDKKKGPEIVEKAEVKYLRDYPATEQEEMIKACYNKKTLKLWKDEDDLPNGTFNMICEQIKELEKPMEKK